MRIEPGLPGATSTDVEAPPSSRADQPPTGWRLWWLAARPKTLSIAVAPVLTGAALAGARHGAVDVLVVAAILGSALLIQAGTNLWNDVGDALRGGDQPFRQGPARVTALGWASPDRVRRAALASFAGAAALGAYLSWVGGGPILALGLASLAAGWGYSGGPRPIAYTALGEVFVLAFFGLGAVGGTYWLLAHALDPAVPVLGVAVGLPAAGVLMANNYRDMEPDRLAGRRTLAIRLGAEGSRLAYAGFLLAPFPLLLAPVAPGGGWLALAVAPWAVRLVVDFATTARGPDFNLILARTARFQLALAALVAGGMLL